jgi:hypothetical protein
MTVKDLLALAAIAFNTLPIRENVRNEKATQARSERIENSRTPAGLARHDPGTNN